jgi:uncharacterized tellurite resistance protein B-like protein
MIAGLRKLMFGNDASASGAADQTDDLHLAAAALLVEAAILDGHLEVSERDAISTGLGEHFGLGDDETAALIEKAETTVADSVELYGFTRTIKDRLEPEERVAILEMIWQVAYADGSVHDYEAGLARRVAGLLYVSDRESGEARKRVLSRLDTGGGSLK